MKEARQTDKGSIKLNSLEILTVRYSITGRYENYDFQSVVSSCEPIDGIDEVCIDILRILRITEVDGKRVSKWVFEHDYGWHAGSDDRYDRQAYEHIRAYLENLPLESQDEMMKICPA